MHNVEKWPNPVKTTPPLELFFGALPKVEHSSVPELDSKKANSLPQPALGSPSLSG